MHKTYKEDTDDELLILLNKGNEDAFAAIYNRYHKLLYTVAYNYLKSAFMAEDAVQYTFLKLWEMKKFLTGPINLRNYLFTIVKNQVLNEIRNNNTAIEKNYEMTQLSPESESDLLALLEEKNMREQLYQAIDRLPEQKKKVCLLKLEGELSNQDIADQMNISVPTVKTHYAQAIKMLQVRFSKRKL
ncbi:DNA-directed RNA polymerase sigma-70 factor [Bacteroidia bacterium]|nr:DNA-directed RNA polymerase sigma-70 factor [Bacteroidia bacterium]